MSLVYESLHANGAMNYPLGAPISLAEASADLDRIAEVRARIQREQQTPQLATSQVMEESAIAQQLGIATGPAALGTNGNVVSSLPVSAGAPNAVVAAPSFGQLGRGYMTASGNATAAAAPSSMLVSAEMTNQPHEQNAASTDSILASILARQTQAAKLAEIAAAEYEAAALDLERATNTSSTSTSHLQPQLQQHLSQSVQTALSAPQGAGTTYDIAMANAKLLSQQLGLYNIPGGALAAALSQGHRHLLSPPMTVAHPTPALAQQVQQLTTPFQPQQQQSQQQSPPPPPPPVPTNNLPTGTTSSEQASAKDHCVTDSNGQNETKQEKEKVADVAPATIEDHLDAAEAVLSLRRSSLGFVAPKTPQTVQQNRSEYPSMPFAPVTADTGHGTANDSNEASKKEKKKAKKKKKMKTKKDSPKKKKKKSATANEASRDGTDDGKKPKRKRAKKKPGQPRRPLSAYNIFFSEERARIIKETEGNAGSEDEDVPSEITEDIVVPHEPSTSAGPLKKRRLSLESSVVSTMSINRRLSVQSDGGTSVSSNSSSPAPSGDDLGAAAGQKAQEILLDRRVNPSGVDPNKRRHRKTHGKIGFRDLARQIGQKWKALPEDRLEEYRRLAEIDMKRYKADMARWNAEQQALKHQ